MSESPMVQFKLNMPAALRERLGQAAERSGRSLTAEVIARLEQSLDSGADWESLLERVSDIEEKLDYVFSEAFPGKIWIEASRRPDTTREVKNFGFGSLLNHMESQPPAPKDANEIARQVHRVKRVQTKPKAKP